MLKRNFKLNFRRKIKILPVVLVILIGIILFISIQVGLSIVGQTLPATQVDRTSRTFGNMGPGLNYVLLGDSLGVGQGGDYEQGFAVLTATNLSKEYIVTMTNFSISGAVIADISAQFKKSVSLKPNLILISVGGNDVTHLTPLSKVKTGLENLIEEIINANCMTKIVLTGSPDMGAVTRFPQPLRHLAGARSDQINLVFTEVSKKYDLTLVPLSKETGPIFRSDPTLLAVDNFHPNTRGYEVMVNVINKSLTESLKTHLTHCK